jgi:tRNA nucleotidyltransferase (CCA-adding enzyme)
MLTFAYLDQLAHHHQILTDILGVDNFWLVGGAIRDNILSTVTEPYDIDLTGAWWPHYRLDMSKKSGISLFHTEKFGTITMLPKAHTSNGQEIKYELTPLRTEWWYQDYRHPGEINRCHDLIADSHRRDFTINCLYYDHVSCIFQPNPSKYTDTPIIDIISHNPNCIVDNVLILTDHIHIDNLYPQWVRDVHVLETLSQTLPSYHTSPQSPNLTIQHIIIDPHGGLIDLTQGKIRAVGNPDHRFQEDALRILRAIRFVNILNQKVQEQFFDLETQTYRSMKKNRYLVQRISKERIHDELIKIFKADNPFGYVALLDDLNILQYIFPHVYRCKGVDQPVRYHPFDIYAHTMLTLYNLQSINDDYLVKIAMLYHDVGKVDQYHTYALGLSQDEVRGVFATRLNHINSGVDMARTDLQALGFSNKEIEIVWRYILNHMVPGQILDAKPDQQPKKLRKLMSEVWYEQVNNLLDLCLGDRMGHYNPLQAPALQGVYQLKDMLKKLYEQEGQFTIKQLDIDGNIVMQEFGLTPWPQVKILLHNAFERVSEDIAHRNQKAIIIAYLKQKKAL